MARQYTLGKNQRLKSRKQIEQLFSEGEKFSVAPLRVFYQVVPGKIIQPMLTVIQFGAGVSAKNFKNAVNRNRVKRLMKEAWRLQKNELTQKLKVQGLQLNVFFIYTAKELPDYQLLKDKTALVLGKLSNKIDESNTATP